jgi:ABC-2 type transport system permease protein
MFLSIFWFEFKYWIRNPAVYFYSTIFFLLGLTMMAGSAGAFGASTNAIRIANSPFNLYSILTLFNKLILFILPAIIGNSIYRDFKSRSFQVMYTFPFTKREYLAGKLLSSLLIVIVICAFAGLGLYLGTRLPGTNNSLLAEFDLAVYVHLHAVYVLPTILIFGSLVFAIVALSRNVYTGFIVIVLLLIGRELLSRFVGISGNTLALLAEPLGETATLFATRNWTIAEQNTKSIPYLGFILLNRFVWLSIACSILVFTYRYFSFSQLGWSSSIFATNSTRSAKNNFGNLIKVKLSAISSNFNWRHQVRLVWRLSQLDFQHILRSGSFLSIVLVGAILVVVLLTQMNPPYETRILPVTWVMLAFPILFFSLLINFLTFLYAGILIHRGRNSRMSELVDVTPVSNGAFVLSKLLAIVKMQMVLLGVIFLAGLSVQVYSGYYSFEVGHYLFDLYAIHLIEFIIWAIAAVFVHTVVSNFYLSLFILILGFFGVSQLQLVGIDSLLFQFNQDIEPGFFMKYSNMNGHGHSLVPYFILKGYWLAIGLFLLIVAVIAWSRGTSQTAKARIISAGESVKGKLGLALVLVIIAVILAGFTVYKMESIFHVPNEATRNQINKSADKKYGHLKNTTQPRIVNVTLTMDLFPENESFESTGVFTLVNKTNESIDTLLVNYSQDAFTQYIFDREYETLLKDSITKFDVNKLKHPLAPGDSLYLYFSVQSIKNTGLFQNSPVLKNGTFITSLIYPGLGYYSSALRGGTKDRIARQNHYRSIDSDYISFQATVSTSSDQIAIAPGYLSKKWNKNGRNYFQYQSANNVTNDYAFTSGRYQVLRDQYSDINLEIYYHPAHSYNLTHLMNGLKSTLVYCEKYFSPYQHKQVRIIEYSRKAGDFAQSFANTIPVSERSFVMDIDENNPLALNSSFLGASHELAHQWWGHQVIPADVNGSRMITESMAEYVSLCVLEEKYGKEKGKLFRRKALDIYLKRRVEDENEKALIENSGLDKSYIPYQKGSLVLYSLRDFLGEEKLNQALRAYLEKVKFQKAPYTIPKEMVDCLRQATPDSLKYLIHDLFETVTLYDNRLKDYDVSKLPNGKYQVTINFVITKFLSKNGSRVFADTLGQAL